MRRNRESIGNVSHADLVGLVLELLNRVEVLEAENAALRTENAALRAENAALKAENAELKARNAKLEARITKMEEQVRASKRASAPKCRTRRS